MIAFPSVRVGVPDRRARSIRRSRRATRCSSLRWDYITLHVHYVTLRYVARLDGDALLVSEVGRSRCVSVGGGRGVRGSAAAPSRPSTRKAASRAIVGTRRAVRRGRRLSPRRSRSPLRARPSRPTAPARALRGLDRGHPSTTPALLPCGSRDPPAPPSLPARRGARRSRDRTAAVARARRLSVARRRRRAAGTSTRAGIGRATRAIATRGIVVL